VVINETLARTFFAGQSPLGHRMQFSRSGTPFYTIVGVVRDIRERGYEASMKPAVYLSIAQAPEIWAVPDHLVVRTRGTRTTSLNRCAAPSPASIRRSRSLRYGRWTRSSISKSPTAISR
jgi:hypothetical protein